MPDHKLIRLRFQPVSKGSAHEIASVVLDRPDRANALSAEMIEELHGAFTEVAGHPNARVLVLAGAGKHFCAGADIQWMKDSAQLDFDQNLAEAKKLTEMIESLSQLEIPTIARVQGCAFGGALGLIAATDIVACAEDARFCLSEVKLGLIPAIITPYLAHKLDRGTLSRLTLTADEFSGIEAVNYRLAQILTTSDQLDETVTAEITKLLRAGPRAQRAFKGLLQALSRQNFQQSNLTAEAIAATRAGDEARQGCDAFFERQKPSWSIEPSATWKWELG